MTNTVDVLNSPQNPISKFDFYKEEWKKPKHPSEIARRSSEKDGGFLPKEPFIQRQKIQRQKWIQLAGSGWLIVSR